MKSVVKKSPVKKAAVKKIAEIKLSEKVVKSLQHLQHLKEELNPLIEEYLFKAKKGIHQPVVYDELRSTISEIKEALKKIRKHIPSNKQTKAK